MGRRIAAAAAAALVAMTTLGACGDGGGGRDVASLGGAADAAAADRPDGEKKSFEDAMLDFARCMRRHGVDMPDPTFAGDGPGVAVIGRAAGEDGAEPSRATFEAADKACKPILDEAHRDMPKPSPEELARMRDESLAVARCMRAKGFDMPDPTFGEDGSVQVQIHSGSAEMSDDQDDTGPASQPDPGFLEAMEACQEEQGGPTPGGARRAGGDR